MPNLDEAGVRGFTIASDDGVLDASKNLPEFTTIDAANVTFVALTD